MFADGSMVTTSIFIISLIAIAADSATVLGSSLEVRCPPGYVITKDNFCDPEAADSSLTDSIQKTENVTEIERTSSGSFPLGQKTMLPRDLEIEYGQQYGYTLRIQVSDTSSILIEIETRNGYQDSTKLDGPGYHIFKIPPNQGDSVTVCISEQTRNPNCKTFITDGTESWVHYPGWYFTH